MHSEIQVEGKNENGFHARVVKWIEDYNLHGSFLIHNPQIQWIVQIDSECHIILSQTH